MRDRIVRPLALTVAFTLAVFAGRASPPLLHAQARPAVTTPTAPAAPTGPRSVSHVVRRDPSITQSNRAGRCVGVEGCVPPAAVVPCAAGATGQTVDATWDARLSSQGQPVAVRGRLSGDGGCTEMGCADHACCNHCTGSVAMVGTGNRRLLLGRPNDPRFACVGDDSGLCCGTAIPAGAVLVRGTLAPVPNSGGSYTIENPILCLLS